MWQIHSLFFYLFCWSAVQISFKEVDWQLYKYVKLKAEEIQLKAEKVPGADMVCSSLWKGNF